MWKNEVMPPFIEWLKQYNDKILRETGNASNKISFYGMDLYSLHRSVKEVIKYLDKVDPSTAEKVRKRYNCFERFGEGTMEYAYLSQFGLSKVTADGYVLLLDSDVADLELRKGSSTKPQGAAETPSRIYR